MPKPSRWMLLCAVVALQTVLLVVSARRHSPAWDETGHLAAGLSHWELGRFDLYSVNPPLVRTLAAAPVYFFSSPKMDWSYYRSDPKLRSEVYLGRRMMQLNSEDSIGFFFLARLAVIPIAVLGTILCFAWGRDLFGSNAGLLAAFLWALSPFTLAYGSVITPDMASAVAGLGASYVAWKWAVHKTWSWALLLSTAFALAMLTKSIWLMLPSLLAAGWGIHACMKIVAGWRAKLVRAELQKLWAPGMQVSAVACCSLLLVNGFYGFQSSFQPLGTYFFASQSLTVPACEDCSTRQNRFDGTLLSGLPVPLPANYVLGIDVQRRDFESGLSNPAWQSYLFGQWKQGGWWYYYLVGLFCKIPLVTWALIVVGFVSTAFWKASPEQRVGVWCLWVPALAVLILLSVNTGLNRYVRYALPVLPVLLIWAGQIASLVTTNRRWPAIPVGIACSLLMLVSLSNAPHWMSYFNLAAGGPQNGHQLLCDSNVDWGQDMLELKTWIKDHPDAAQRLHLAAFCSYDPAYLGIDYVLPPKMHQDARSRMLFDQRSQGPQPGVFIISKNYLVGHSMPVPDGDGSLHFQHFEDSVFSYFAELTPTDRIGHSMLVYEVSDTQAAAARKRLGLVPLSDVRVASTELNSSSETQVVASR